MSRILPFTISIVVVLGSPSADAACSSPVANLGALDFQNPSWKFCDGSNWQDLGSTSFPLQGPDGSAGAPTYSFSAGTNTGIYSTGAGTLSFATAGSHRITIDSSGYVGIGTTNPLGPFNVHANAGANTQIKLSDDDVAHGMTAITQTNVYGRILSIDGSKGGLTVEGYNDDGTNFGVGILAILGSATPTATVPAISFKGAKANGTTLQALATSETLLDIRNSNSPVVTVLGGGNVGIGTTSPRGGLEVATTGTLGSAILIPRDTTANRPSPVVAGMVRYNSTNNAFEGYAGTSWNTLGERVVYKSATQSVTSSTTFVNDSDLQFTLNANETWAFEFECWFDNNAGTTDNLKVDLTGPASPTNLVYKISMADTYDNVVSAETWTAYSQAVNASNTASTITATSPGILIVKGTVENGSNSGTFAMRFAQVTSNATAIRILRGSVLKLKRLN